MHSLEAAESRRRRRRFIVLLLLLGLCLIGGGASRADVVSLIYLRPAAVLAIVALILLPGKRELAEFRAPLLLLAALAGTMLIQLVPLPPDLWLKIPGRAQFAEAAEAASIAQPWRPLSLTPDLTLNSLLALLPPLAALLGMASIGRKHAYSLLPILICVALASAVLGVVQLTGGPDSPARTYRITNGSSAVGFFANRNHQAALLAITFPLLAAWASQPGRSLPEMKVKWVIAAAIGVFLIPMVLVTGSRAGLGLSAMAIIVAVLLAPRGGPRPPIAGRWSLMAKLFALMGAVAVPVAAVVMSRAEAFERLFSRGIEDDERFANMPIVIDMIRDFLPFGTGFGAFDPAFRAYEQDRDLQAFYFNHAHNDLLELVLTGGLPAAAVLLAFLLWWGRVSLALFRKRATSDERRMGRLGSAVILLLLVSSLVDYPLRTPIMSALFAIACGWLCLSRDQSKAELRTVSA